MQHGFNVNERSALKIKPFVAPPDSLGGMDLEMAFQDGCKLP
jgi:hypothetical protein